MESSWLICFKTENIKKHLIFWSFQNIFRVYRKKPTSKHSSWRRLMSLSSEDVFKTSSRRLEQDEYARLSLTSTEDVFKTSSRCLAKMSSRSVKDVFKTCWRRLQDMQRYFQDVFKMYHQLRLFLLTRVREVFRNILFQRRLSTGGFA